MLVITPMITIVTVVKDAYDLIEPTLLNVINQKDRDIEYIVIDGVSIDGTLDIIQKYTKDIDLLISEPDMGIYDAMNKGIQRANGRVIGLLNAGDLYENGALELVKQCVVTEGVEGVYYGDTSFFYNDLNKTRLMRADLPGLVHTMSMSHQAVFVSKSIYEKFGLYDLQYKYASDYSYLLSIYLNRVKFIYLGKSVVIFSSGGASEAHLIKTRLELISILFSLKSPSRYLGLLKRTYEIIQFIAYKMIEKAMGKRVAYYLREKLFHHDAIVNKLDQP